MADKIVFFALVALAEISGLTAVVLIGLFGGQLNKEPGFSWDGSLKTFNYHPLLMVIAFIFLQGNGAIAYRVISATGLQVTRTTAKLIHGAFQTSAFLIATVGLVATFKFHETQGWADMYHPHSWVGITAFSLYGLQLLVGFLFLVFPKFGSEVLRSRVLSLHVSSGRLIFILMIGSALMGMSESSIYDIVHPEKFPPEKFPQAVVVSNTFCLCLLLFAATIVSILWNPTFGPKRQKEDSVELITSSQRS
ncbi:transmembrane ascorbate-dependent reductase CYB561-like [Antedon mediterranea]|uniref:transmembrane ascorbate-dependent reductase CYB561-like n=1 Tax=Antedon mediterranea TaxID=105859 RepID=UPI003AF5EB8F